ncbi:MAG: hypothetical protein ABII07_01560 [Patescibacteria group bacterium]|nr:hypothetical protein [Patescibacteria group bacterium]
MSDTFTVDRKEASEMIGVSLRTLDRYIRLGRLKARKMNGFIKLDENEVKSLKVGYVPRERKTDETIEIRSHRSLNDFERDDSNIRESIGQVIGEDVTANREAETVYEVLYKESKDELKEYQQRLEVANYRVGQLEAKLESSVPLLEYKASSLKSEKREAKLKKIARQQFQKAKSMKKQLEIEKLNAKVYIVLLFGLLLMQPVLWWALQK